MEPPVHQDIELVLHLRQKIHFHDKLDQPENLAKLLEHQGDLTLVVLQANLHLVLYSLYFYHCKPINNVEQKDTISDYFLRHVTEHK